ncbi:MAG: tetratricopeptide repeat protein [Rhodospirillales bacterium]|nr:tetratricopeptide repeat protein [Rhodospirillales bacterium]
MTASLHEALRHHQAGRLEDAARIYQAVLKAHPRNADALHLLGLVAHQKGQHARARTLLARALKERPGDARFLNVLAGVLRAEGRLEEAAAQLRQALARSPHDATVLTNLGLVLQDLGDSTAALAAYDQALTHEPDQPEARANRAILLLQQGRFEDGWREYKWRWRVPGFTTPARSFAAPAWDGAPLAERTLFVHAEQGLGSAIQFVRYVPLVAAEGGRVVLECQPPLRRLFEGALASPNGPAAQLIVKGDALPAFDVHAPLMSLPHLLGTTFATIPAEVPYLTAPADACARWAERLASAPRPRVGLTWAGNRNHPNDRNRSLAADALAPLVRAGAASFFSLQVGQAEGVAAFPAGTVTDLAPALTDFAETAAVISGLDLVISVDTAVAHLAGALAKSCWLLLPEPAEWRWLERREDSPWYPTFRLFRQRARGDWVDVVARVTAALKLFRLQP